MALEEQLDAWAKGYLEAERLPCLAVAVTQGNEVIIHPPRRCSRSRCC